jgi:hypothetical protein
MHRVRSMLVLLAIMSVSAAVVEPAFADNNGKGGCRRHHCHRGQHHRGMNKSGGNGGMNRQANQQRSTTPTAAPAVPAQ